MSLLLILAILLIIVAVIWFLLNAFAAGMSDIPDSRVPFIGPLALFVIAVLLLVCHFCFGHTAVTL